ncbi:MAG: 1-deoxy-D-xylulose-5-phosphate reductoisomerase [Clostridia bacterium]|nr:1-deoxy-D-xylulose-5-phosphate reductoisomerase [Clostridia bacterium]
MNKITILGSTGSIGTQTIDVAKHLGLEVEGISANRNAPLVIKQYHDVKPKYISISDKAAADKVRSALIGEDVTIIDGKDSAKELAQTVESDTVVNAIIGFAGLVPTLSAIERGKNIALANKETLVSAGSLVMSKAREKNVPVLPIDSEHCAIHQCLRSCKKDEVDRLIITASGGPFFGYTKKQLESVTKEQALKHPNWSMGTGITIYSSTLVNKGLEMIEAMHLFDFPMEKIDVIVNRESIIHSMVETVDGSVMAQLGASDMRLCIQYALTYPERVGGISKKLNLIEVGKLTFFDVDNDVFPSINLARRAVKYGGYATSVYNAANEACVDMFMQDKIRYVDIFDIMDRCVEHFKGGNSAIPSVEEIIMADTEAKEFCKNLQR